MPPRKKISIGGLTKLSSDYSATIDVEDDVVPPTPKVAPKGKKARVASPPPPPPPPEDLESEEEEVVPEPAKNRKAREMSEEHKQALRDRLATMREKQKQMREEKALQKVETKKPLTNLDDIFEKKYNSQFDFLREKLTALTDDMSEMKRAKKEKAELKAKEAEDRKIREEIKRVAPPPPKPVVAPPPPKPVVAPPKPVAEVPYVFQPPINDITSFRQQFRKGF
jgi:hypothetical protein